MIECAREMENRPLRSGDRRSGWRHRAPCAAYLCALLLAAVGAVSHSWAAVPPVQRGGTIVVVEHFDRAYFPGVSGLQALDLLTDGHLAFRRCR